MDLECIGGMSLHPTLYDGMNQATERRIDQYLVVLTFADNFQAFISMIKGQFNNLSHGVILQRHLQTEF